MSETGLLVDVAGHAGRVTLDRPAALNALTLDMVRAFEAALDRFEADAGVRSVVVDASGDRAFCAGGDIRWLYDAAVAGDLAKPRTFWAEEYHLDARIARFPKPIVTIVDGIAMGGGIGVASHARHRVVTEHATVAMPEVGIGFAPDVGGTWLLARAPGELGTHLALTGSRVGHADAIHVGLADTHVPRAALGDLLDALTTADEPGEAIDALAADAGEAPLAEARAWIDEAYAGDDPVAIVARLRSLADEGAAKAADAIEGASPTSVSVALRSLRTARDLPSLEACLEQEYRMATTLVEGHDFVEGVRAAVVDKDRSPRWRPARLTDVRTADVDAFFAPRDHDIHLTGTEVAR